MPKEFVRPLRSRSTKPTAKKRAGKRAPKTKKSTSRQTFWIAVAFWIVLIASIQAIVGGSAKPSHRVPQRIRSLGLTFTSVDHRNITRRLGAQTQTTSQPAITAWRGPVQPLSVSSSGGLAPVVLKIPTTEPVVFVGIDDGWIQTPDELDWLASHHLPFTLFLTNNGIKNDYGFFQKLQDAGMTIQDHTLSHPHLAKLNFDQQKTEICQTADIYQSVFGRRPTLFRPPYGEYNDDTRRAAASCGIKAVVMWHVVIGTGGDVQYQSVNHHLQPGDIVLMHFRPEFLADVKALSKEVEQNHLQIGRLEDWLP